ncbi:hypothetical protein [Amycolatopsis sp. NPDC051061]|uniref:hypothetical protein n=1 Tax=Amycolatopsis sp. NPDC051061 TaxID=3155042 RepID=UPI003435F912
MLAFAMAAHRLLRPAGAAGRRGHGDRPVDRKRPDDLVAYWVFDDPGILRDTSSKTIAAAALLKLAELVPDGENYRLMARRTVQALVGGYLRTVPGMPPSIGMLGQGCYNKLLGLATDHELVWGITA